MLSRLGNSLYAVLVRRAVNVQRVAAGEPTLFDLVPWEYGFVHSGALAWLLDHDRYGTAVLRAARDRPWTDDVRVTSVPQREARVGRRSADLAFTVSWQDHDSILVAFETKVQDLLEADQIRAYKEAGHQPLLYLPGITGLLASRNPTMGADEAVLTGEMFCHALAPVEHELPALLRGYFGDVRHESQRFAAAVAHADGKSVDITDGKTATQTLIDIAWITAVIGELQDRCGADAASTIYPVDKLASRDVAFDRGFFWEDTHTTPAGDFGEADVGYYIDLIVVKATGERAVVIKAGFARNADVLALVYDHAQDVGPPSGRWSRGRRRLTGESVGCWKAIAANLDASEAAELALEAARWIRSVGL